MRDIKRTVRTGLRPRKVFEFDSSEGTCRGVVFGDPRDKIDVKYYTPDSFIGERVFAVFAVGDGVRSVDAKSNRRLEMGTPRVDEIRTRIEDEVVDSEYAGSLGTSGFVLSDESRGVETYRTLLQDNGQPVGMIGFKIKEARNGPRILEQDVIYHTDDISTLGHKGCVFGWCADGCHVLCTAFSGTSHAACRAACIYSGAGLIFSAACGQVCQGIAYGACYPSCKAVVH